VLLSPQIPLLYMGEEYGEARPFQFFTDFTGELAKAVYKGRSEEFRRIKSFTDAFAKNAIPDPNGPETFNASRLDPASGDTARQDFVKRLLDLRHTHIVPLLPKIAGAAGCVEALADGAFSVAWKVDGGATLSLTANLGASAAKLPAATGDFLFEYPQGAAAELMQGTLPPWSVVCRLRAAEPSR
jgi:maltooligosyltrehalose trehalohydrolase